MPWWAQEAPVCTRRGLRHAPPGLTPGRALPHTGGHHHPRTEHPMPSIWNRIRRVSARTTILAGDAQALSRGRIVPRVANRVVGRVVSRSLRRVWR